MSDVLPQTGVNNSPANGEKDWTQAIEKVAGKVVQHGMEMPVVLFLEAHKPVTFFVNQLLIFLAPILSPVFGGKTERLAEFFEERDNVEKLILSIEEKSAGKKAEKKLLKSQKKSSGDK
jgi:hypothetical protein